MWPGINPVLTATSLAASPADSAEATPLVITAIQQQKKLWIACVDCNACRDYRQVICPSEMKFCNQSHYEPMKKNKRCNAWHQQSPCINTCRELQMSGNRLARRDRIHQELTIVLTMMNNDRSHYVLQCPAVACSTGVCRTHQLVIPVILCFNPPACVKTRAPPKGSSFCGASRNDGVVNSEASMVPGPLATNHDRVGHVVVSETFACTGKVFFYGRFRPVRSR